MSENKKAQSSLQDAFLNQLRKQRVSVSIYLVNGIKLQGKIESFDRFVVQLRATTTQIVFKHAISTIVPSEPFRMPYRGDEAKAADEGCGEQRPAPAAFAVPEELVEQ